ncbi:protein DGCR6L isoform X5 [Pongo pygmaeus]|uniref:protein DGCR6L isoform X5 n=1 Tax=Pongo pygmaeus TaxID=9600 RepID=UPI0023E0AAF0|nr:protein DGCR6L isoform X10 [Pongo pygmaeus]
MCPPLPWLCRCSGCCLPRRTPGLQDRAALAGHGDAVADGHRSMKRTAQAGAAAEAPGSPAGLPAPQPACTSGGSAARTRELPSPPPTPSPAPWQAVEHRIHEEQRAMDRKIVLELDRKVADQQSTLEKAGVAGFYVTTNPQELMLQMNLLELIRKLQQRGCQAGKAALGLGGPWQSPAAQCDQEGSPVPP